MKIIQTCLIIPLFFSTIQVCAMQASNSNAPEYHQPSNNPATYKMEKTTNLDNESCSIKKSVLNPDNQQVTSTANFPLPCETTALSLGAFFQNNKTNAGIEGSITFEHSHHQASKLSIGFSIKEKGGLSDLFRNLSYTHYYHFGQKELNPYIGLGAVLGGTFDCSEEEEECEETGMASVYPEIGLMIRTKKFAIYPFVRRYDFNKHNTFGLSIGRRF